MQVGLVRVGEERFFTGWVSTLGVMGWLCLRCAMVVKISDSFFNASVSDV